MVYNLLTEIIDGRDVQSLPCSAARAIVREFYLRLSLKTFGQRNQQKVEYLANQALKKAGLECFA